METILIYNIGNNNLELFKVLEMFLFTTSEAALDIFHKNNSTRVVSRVGEPPKTLDPRKLEMMNY